MKLMRILILFFFIVVDIYSYGFSSQSIRTYWTTNQGLVSDTVNDILQDKSGYIILATYDGLVRFDGIKFELINKYSNPDYKSVSARVLLEDKNSNLWVGTNGDGIARFKDDEITMFTEGDGLPDNSIRSVAEDQIGRIWIGTTKGLAYIYNDKVITFKNSSVFSNNELIEVIYCDNSGRIWFSSTSPGIYYFDEEKGFIKSDIISDKYTITSIYDDGRGDFWLGTKENGALLYRNGVITEFNKKKGFNAEKVNHIMKDSSGKMWFATDSGIITYFKGNISFYTEEDELINNLVEKVIEDREGNFWIATARGGIEKLSKSKFINYDTKDGLVHSTVNTVKALSDGRIWIGTDVGISCFNKGKFENNKLTDYLKEVRIRQIISESGILYISTYSDLGLVISDSNKIKKYNASNGLTGNRVRLSYIDNKRNIWVGTTNGLNIINSKGIIRQIKRSEGLTNDYIMCIFEDKNGSFWIGTDGGGINIIDYDNLAGIYKIRHINMAGGLAGNVIFRIYEDKNGIIWVTTGSGISKIEDGKINNFNVGNGFVSDSIFQILEDNYGRVWMTSTKGVSYCKKTDLDTLARDGQKKINVIAFDKSDGLRGGVTSTSWSDIDSEGRLWFPTLAGVSLIEASNIYINKNPPLVEVKGIKLDDKYIKAKDKITIDAGIKRVTVDYTGLSFTVPEKVLFSCKLEGFDKDYSLPSASRFTSYTNLPPGNYIFKVKAQNNDGIWQENPAFIRVIQKPFFYQEFWFYILLVIFMISIFYGFHYLRVKHFRKREIELENIVRSRTEDLRNEKMKSDELLLNILPHSIANRLKNGEETIADKFDEASILFADIVNFTKLSSQSTHYKLLYYLNSLFSEFDRLTEEFGIEKIKTIGDAYMAAGGIPEAMENHAEQIINFAFAMLEKIDEFNDKFDLDLQMRIGINSGSVVAGVIGKKKFIYDLWGDAVNVASRMEHLGEAGKIQITERTHELVLDKFEFEDRGEIEVKGKGFMKTYNILKKREI